ncbi:DoxX family protein [Desertivirga brevis]|uniref:DoxX family protein n=1 Tax=Desertivirga brevis TaxID=2810310 RepID=UPI001A96FF2A|nr:DoxX family protein [Pedobacter sp. SYSU D00873]
MLNSTTQLSGFAARIILALVILPHGLQMAFGNFGGYGFNATMAYFTESMGLPSVLGIAVIVLEVLLPILLLTGFLVRFSAFVTMVMFIGMIITSHLSHGFFMNWTGHQGGEGYEYHLLVIGLASVLLLDGAGRFSVDRWIWNRYAQKA